MLQNTHKNWLFLTARIIEGKLRRLSGGQQRHQTASTGHRQNVVEGGSEGTQEVEAGKDDHRQEQGIVVEDGESGRFVFGDIVLLPQDAFVLFLAADFLVIGQQSGHLPGDGILPLVGNLVLQGELGVLVGHGHQVGAQSSNDGEEYQRRE